MGRVRYPSLYQVNTRVWLRELSRTLGRAATLDHLARVGFDWVWFLGVWQTGAAGREVPLNNPEWRREFQELLPDLQERPEYYVPGTEADLAREPHNYCRVQTPRGPQVMAYGRDPHFLGWPDTLQLNYGHPSLQEAMRAELSKIAGWCDGVRCDMAMLIVPEVFQRTWGIAVEPSWPFSVPASGSSKGMKISCRLGHPVKMGVLVLPKAFG